MYKRIIHNIVEECYYDDAMPEVLVKANQKLVKTASDLQLSADNLIMSIVSNIRGYIVNSLISSDVAQSYRDKSIYHIEEFGRVIDGFYGAGAGLNVTSYLKNFTEGLDRILTLAKTNMDYRSEFENTLLDINAAAVSISDLNPEHWPESVVKEYLRAYAGSIADQISSRIKNDWDSDFRASGYANRIMYNGPVVIGAQRGMPDFAEVFASGIFKQFPQKF